MIKKIIINQFNVNYQRMNFKYIKKRTFLFIHVSDSYNYQYFFCQTMVAK